MGKYIKVDGRKVFQFHGCGFLKDFFIHCLDISHTFTTEIHPETDLFFAAEITEGFLLVILTECTFESGKRPFLPAQLTMQISFPGLFEVSHTGV